MQIAIASMAGLVADYGTSSSSEDSEREEEHTEDMKLDKEKEGLATAESRLPGFASELLGASVFSNPFRAAEDARRAVLEKHVKLTAAVADLRAINGKQVCWNYRKGRCRFGRGCKFAHDSDLQRGTEDGDSEAVELARPGATGTVPDTITTAAESDAMKRSLGAETDTPRRKRPGLSHNIAPGKKVVQMFNRTRKGPLV